jgi:hypothetical protein
MEDRYYIILYLGFIVISLVDFFIVFYEYKTGNNPKSFAIANIIVGTTAMIYSIIMLVLQVLSFVRVKIPKL